MTGRRTNPSARPVVALLLAALLGALACGGRGERPLALFSAGDSLGLTVRPLAGDLALALVRSGTDSLAWTFSQLFPLSTGRPWSFQPREFVRIGLRQAGDTLLLEGLDRDSLLTVARLSFQGQLLRIETAWEQLGGPPREDLAVVLALPLRHDPAGERVTMPHILYNDNPSADPARLVPHLGKEPGGRLVCEETRFPVPAVNLEWDSGERPLFVTLFSLPGPDPDGWSLGLERSEGQVDLLGASGVLALNGEKDHTYGLQCRSVPLAAGYRSFAPGDRLEKTWLLEFGRAEAVGRAFRSLVRTGYEIYRPRAVPCLSTDSVVALKANALANRWCERDGAAGFLAVLPDNYFERPPYFLYGWTGAGLRLAWCSAKLGIERGEPAAVERAVKAVEFYLRGSRTGIPGLRYNYYYLEERRWTGNDGWEAVGERVALSSRAAGESLANLGKLVRLWRDSGREVPTAWAAALREGADFLLRESSRLPEGIFPAFWTEQGLPADSFPSSAGTPCVLGILEAFKLTGDSLYLREAMLLAERYWRMNGDRFDRPFSRSTLDAACEDKEAGIYFFLSADELFLLTGDSRYREWAEVSADWILTFVYFWRTGFRPGSTCDRNGFITTGWPGVSVQNHHLDVFFPAWELYDLGRRTGDTRYQELGRMVFEAFSHGICRAPGEWDHQTPGEQGEQYYQTNYGITPDYWRGGYHRWSPAWIIGQVLEPGLHFQYDHPAGGS